jgi:hypothetical protein
MLEDISFTKAGARHPVRNNCPALDGASGHRGRSPRSLRHAQTHETTETIFRVWRHRRETSGDDVASCPAAIPPLATGNGATPMFKTLSLAIAIAATAAAAPAHADFPSSMNGTSSNGCSNKTVSGSYGAQLAGTSGDQSFAEVGIFITDGKGNVTGQDIINLGGKTIPRDLTGTYHVDPDCTATVELNLPGGSTAHFFGVIVLGGNEVDLNNTDPGNVVAGSIKKINPAKSSDRF